MRTILIGGGLLALTLGCTGIGDAVHARGFSRYAEKVVAQSGAPLTVRTCQMRPSTREGWCELDGSMSDIDALLTSLGARATPTDAGFGEPCLELYRFSEGESPLGGWAPRDGVQRYALDGPVPPTQENVRLRWIYVEPTGRTACLSLEYPYG